MTGPSQHSETWREVPCYTTPAKKPTVPDFHVLMDRGVNHSLKVISIVTSNYQCLSACRGKLNTIAQKVSPIDENCYGTLKSVTHSLYMVSFPSNIKITFITVLHKSIVPYSLYITMANLKPELGYLEFCEYIL